MEIADWLRGLSLERYAETFRDNAIDVAVLPELCESDLGKLGILLGHRKMMLRAIAALRGTAALTIGGLTTAPPPAYVPLLADKIRQAKATVEGERKQVTVLFADVKGSMELAEQLDPEAWSQIKQRFFRIFCDGIERFEGFVDKFTGDGGMALFDAPIAHEDHAQCACYAALHLRDAAHAYQDSATPAPLKRQPPITQRSRRAQQAHRKKARTRLAMNTVWEERR